MNSSIEISLNGRCIELPGGSLQDVLAQQGFDLDAAMACAINGQFVPRTQWTQRLLQADDRIDVITPITGG